MSPAEAAERLAAARRELDLARALGDTRELAAWQIAVEVLSHLSSGDATR